MGRQLAVIVLLILLAPALPAQELPAPALPEFGVVDDICFLEGDLLCVQGGRFRAQVQWRDFRGNAGVGQSVKLTFEAGYFWFFGRGNAEIMLKVLDGRAINGHFWVFFGSLTNVEFTVTVTDILTGAQRVYFNPSGLLASVGDVQAFPTEPKCGGFAGVPCPGHAICDFPPGQCQIADNQGICVPRPDVCPAIFMPVCGCDGVTYGNDCERLQAGVAKDHDGECGR